MTTEQFLGGTGEGLSADGHRDMERWRDDCRQLREWEERLRAYEEALAMVKSDESDEEEGQNTEISD